jgi:signal transduction histidine kinase
VAGAERITYFYDDEAKKIFRRVGDGSAQSITSSGIVIEDAHFLVEGSDEQGSTGNITQPTITIYLEAKAKDDPTAKSYYIQTTVTQRTLDL